MTRPSDKYTHSRSSPYRRYAHHKELGNYQIDSGLLGALLTPLKSTIAAKVISFFNDASVQQKAVVRQTDALLSPESVTWRVHGDVASMMVGGIASLMLQMLHPAVLAGVWDHSNFKTDMLGRLRRTARFIALTTHGKRSDAGKRDPARA